jgi:Ca2+-binding EF-hand superfamily protein
MSFRHLPYLFAAAGAALLASPVWAEDPPPPKETQFFEKFDTNLDGRVTKEEFAAGSGDAAAFTLLDKNKDDAICPDELGLPADYKPKPRAERKPAPGDEGAKPGAAPGGRPGDEMRRKMKEMDADGDGRVSRAEWKGEAEAFDRFDKNKDGFLDKEDAPRGMGMGGGQPGMGGGRIDPEAVKARWKKMDRDGDGKVSKEEYTGDFDFANLDADKDGYLTDADLAKLGEAMGAGGPGGAGGGKAPPPLTPEEVAKRFAEMDKDQSGKVEAAEMPEMLRERMLKADADADGALSKDEFAEGMKKAQRGPGQGGPGQGGGKGGKGGKGGPGAGANGGGGGAGGPPGKPGEAPQAPGLEILKRFDHDHDGKVERDQFPGSDEKFAELDKDGDGVLTEKDFPAAPAKPPAPQEVPPAAGGLMATMDKDGDGKLSRAEFRGSNDEWRALDRNQDGWVDAEEAKAAK